MRCSRLMLQRRGRLEVVAMKSNQMKDMGERRGIITYRIHRTPRSPPSCPADYLPSIRFVSLGTYVVCTQAPLS